MKKNVLIIGASGDIGLAIVKELINDGYQLILHYNKNRTGIEEIRKVSHHECILAEIQADLCNTADVKNLLSKLVFPVDYIVFASGMANHGLFQDVSDETMDDMLSLHVKAPWLITKHLLPAMIQRRLGKIIFITSIWGSVGASNEVIYSAVKGAQNSFVKALAKEVGSSGISVNAISPGFIDTKMNSHLLDSERESIISEIPINRAGKPSDIAHTVSFLFNEKSSYIQGGTIPVNGGW